MMIDLQGLVAEFTHLGERYREWHSPIVAVDQESWRKVHKEFGYTLEDKARDMNAVFEQQLDLYNPYQAEVPARERLLALYQAATPEEQALIRAAMAKLFYAEHVLYRYILKCAECIESPEDGDILFSGLVAAAIDNCAHDFRDFGYVTSELAIAARDSGIDIEPHAKAIAPFCDDKPTPGGCYPSVKARLAQFHIYAQDAVHVFGDDDPASVGKKK
jgi:hypothetical protein